MVDKNNETTNTDRTSRSAESREKTSRRKPWSPPSLLDAPNPPEGYVYRWIRESMVGQQDQANMSKRIREGWEPVRAEDHPEIFSDAVADARFKDNVIVGGLMLCKAPIELVEERTEYYENLTESQMRSVDQSLMRENDPRMPIFNDRKTKVTFGKGN